MKAYRVYWQGEDSHERHERLETDDPVEAETHYFELCRMRTPRKGWVYVHSTKQEDVPNACFSTLSSIRWDVDRESVEERRDKVWALPEELQYKRWRSPTIYMAKGLRQVMENDHGDRASGEAIARKIGMSARAVRYYIAIEGESRSIAYPTWRSWLELAGF